MDGPASTGATVGDLGFAPRLLHRNGELLRPQELSFRNQLLRIQRPQPLLPQDASRRVHYFRLHARGRPAPRPQLRQLTDQAKRSQPEYVS